MDLVHYEWTYFEGDAAAWVHEDMIRWTQMLPKQPSVHIFNTGVECGRNDGTFLRKTYAKYGFNVFSLSDTRHPEPLTRTRTRTRTRTLALTRTRALALALARTLALTRTRTRT